MKVVKDILSLRCQIIDMGRLCEKLTSSAPTGTSSILAGALLAAVYRCTGRTCPTDSLIHAVLHLEQVLTTGKAGLTCGGEGTGSTGGEDEIERRVKTMET